MEIVEYTQMENQEKNYWWHVGRRYVLEAILSKFLRTNDLKILDLGCGTGINFQMLKRWGNVTGLDSEPEALDYCRQKSAYHQLIQGDAMSPPQNQYDLVTAFDLLEHLENDQSALSQWYASLKSGGYVFLTVPAYQWLFGAHDKALHHKRRYSSFELSRKLKAAGFNIKFLSPFFFFVFPIFATVRLINKFAKPKTTYETASVATGLDSFLVGLSQIESQILSTGIGLPWGSSILVIAQKK